MDPLEHILHQLQGSEIRSHATREIEASTLNRSIVQLQVELDAALKRLSSLERFIANEPYSPEHTANLELHHEKTQDEINRKRRALQELNTLKDQLGRLH